MGRLKNKGLKKKIILTSMLAATLLGTTFLGKSYAQDLIRSVSDHTGDYPLPRYITYEQYINDPFLLCTGHGIALPGYNSTWVISGDNKTHQTDQGKDTGKLTANDLGAATCFADGTYKGLVATQSKTYGYFTEKNVYDATPAEAYVLAELNDNTPGNGVTFEETGEEYTEEVNEEAYIDVDGTRYFMVEYDDTNIVPDAQSTAKYVVKKGDKYYVVNATNDGGQGNYSAVQVAWWEVGTKQEGTRSGGNSLSDEAFAFEEYIKSLNNGEVEIVEGEEEVADEVETITLNYNELTMSVGESETLTYGVYPSNVRRANITWTTSDKSIATVNKDGKVKALKKGKVLITLALKDNPDIKATCLITVGSADADSPDEEDPEKEILLDRNVIVIKKGETGTVNITPIPKNLKYEAEIPNQNIAKCTQKTITGGKMKIKGLKVGETKVTVSAKDDSSVKVVCKIKVIDSNGDVGNIKVYRIGLNKEKTTMVVGDTETLKATVYPNDATNKKVKYKSSKADVAEVDDKGVITAKKEGTTKITVTSEDNSNVKATCKVTVQKEGTSDVSDKNPATVDGEFIGQVVSKKNLFKVEYKPTQDSSKAKVLFDETTNKYKIGPFSTNYVRKIVKCGNREAADFAGITGSILTGKFYEDGKEVIKDIPVDNYKFVYDHDHTEKIAEQGQDSEGNNIDEKYIYPYSDEEFYIELDYLEGLSAITKFNFNYHYWNGGGTYTVFHGTYLKINWKVNTTYLVPASSDTSGGDTSYLLNKSVEKIQNEIDLQKVDNYYGKSSVKVDIKKASIQNYTPLGTTNGMSVWASKGSISDKTALESEDCITFKYATPGHMHGLISHKSDLQITSVAGATISSKASDRIYILKVDRDYNYLVKTFKVTINYKCTDCGKRFTDTIDGYYSNIYFDRHISKFLEEMDLKLETSNSRAGINEENGTYYVSRQGFIGGNGEGTTVKATAKVTPKVEEESGNLGTFSGNSWNLHKSELNGKIKITFGQTITLGSVDNHPSLEVTIPVAVKKPFTQIDTKKIVGGMSVTFYLYNLSGDGTGRSSLPNATSGNIYGLNTTFSTSTGQLYTTYITKVKPVTYEGFLSGISFKGNPDLAKSVSDKITVNFKDSNSNNVTVYIEFQGNYKPEVTPEPSEEETGDDDDDDTNGGDDDTEQGDGQQPGDDDGQPGGSGGGSGGDGDTVFSGNDDDTTGDTSGTPVDDKLVPTTATENKAQPQTTPGGGDDDDDDDVTPEEAETELETGAAYIIDTETSGEFLTPDGTPELDLTTGIGGMVWEDFENFEKGADTKANGIYQESDGDKKLSNIEVRIWRVVYEKDGDTYSEVTSGRYARTLAEAYRKKTTDENGSIKLEERIKFDSDKIEDRLFTDDKGDYKAYLTIPSIEGLDVSKYKVSYDVEFIYDGQTYEVTEYLASTGKTKTEEKVQEFESTSATASDAGENPSTIDYSKYANDSYAIETYEERNEFDESFTQIKGDKEIQSDGTTVGKAEDTSGNAKELDYTSEDQGFDPDPTGEADATNNGNDETRKVSTLVTKDSEGYVKDEFKMKARTSTAGLLLPYEDRIHVENMKEDIPLEYVDTHQEGAFTYYKPVTEYFSHINLGLVTRDTTDVSVTKDLYKAEITVNNDELTYKYSSLKDYEQSNYADTLNLLLDMQNSGVEYELGLYASDFYYRSDVYKPETDAEVIKKSIYDEKKNSELRLFTTYKFSVYNDSTTQDMSINRISDYFDSSFTPIAEEVKAKVNNADGIAEETVVAEPSYYRIYNMMASDMESSPYKYNKAEDTNIKTLYRTNRSENENTPMKTGTVTWQVDDTFSKELAKLDGTDEAGKYKKMYTDTFTSKNSSGTYTANELTLRPGEKIEVFVTFEVDHPGYSRATEEDNEESSHRNDLLGGKNNVVEVSNYTTFYTNSSLNKNNNVAYKAGEISGRVDKDSAPDNVNFNMTAVEENNGVKYTVLDKKWFEDDTESAPVFRIFLRNPQDTPRTLDGMVWEDELNKDVEDTLNTKTGDGKYQDGEKTVQGVTVSLVEKIKLKDKDTGEIREYEYVWPDNAFGQPSETKPSYTSVLMTDKDGKYKFSNFVAGDYVVRFEYGNTALTMKYNGQDYKNTAYQTGIKNPTQDNIINKYKETNELGEEIIHYEKMNNDQYIDGAGINTELTDQITINNEWHDLTGLTENLSTERVSDARDYEARRLDVIKNSRTISNTIAEILAVADSDEATELITKVKEKMNTGNMTYGSALNEVINASGNEKLKELVNSDKYKALIELNAMEANTAKLNIEVETAGKISYAKNKKSVNGTFTITAGGKYEDIKEIWDNDEKDSKKEYHVENIDFGIERRPNTIVQLDKYLEGIELTKQNQKIFSVTVNEDGTINTEGESTAQEKILTVEESYGIQGFKYINIEEEYLKNTKVAIKYKIRVNNKSEADFASETLVKTYTPATIGNYVTDIYNSESTKSGENIKYGKYLGLYYYTHDKQAIDEEKHVASEDYKDASVKTRVDRLVEYIDPNSSGVEESTTTSENSAWGTSLPTNVAESDKTDGKAVVKGERVKALKGLISDESYSNMADSSGEAEYYLADEDGRIYISETRNLVQFSHSDKIVEKTIETNRLDRGEKGEGQLTYQDKQSPRNKKYTTVTNGSTTNAEVFKVNDVFVYDNNNGSEYVPDAFNTKLTQELDTMAIKNNEDYKPSDEEDAIIHITIKNDIANDVSLENMIYYNLAEVLVYSNSVGRRSMNAIPGNAFEYVKQEVTMDEDRMVSASGIWEAGHSSNMSTNDEVANKIRDGIASDKDTNNLMKTMKYAVNTNKAMNEYNRNSDGYTVYTIAELDADSTDFVTFTEPTGLSSTIQQQNIIIIALLIALVLLAVGIIVITIKVVLRKSTDDIVIESTKEE